MIKKIVYLLCCLFLPTIVSAVGLVATPFPKTVTDLSFSDKWSFIAAGYEPFKDGLAYSKFDLIVQDSYLQELERQSERDFVTMSWQDYCRKYPNDADRCPNAQLIDWGVGAKPVRTNGLVFDNKTRGGKCTPPAKSNVFVNKILTSGHYATISPVFEKSMITIFRKEGDFSNDPDDAGGATKYGISSAANPDVNLATLTRRGAEDIAYNKYFVSCKINDLPDSVSFAVMQAGFTSGPGRGINLLRQMLNLPQTGVVDSGLIAAVENYNGDIHNDYLDVLREYWTMVSRQGKNQKFYRGWMNAIQLFRENGCHVYSSDVLTR